MLIDNAHEVHSSVLHNLGDNIDGVIQDELNIVPNPVGVEDDGYIKFESNLREVMSKLYPGYDFCLLKFVLELYKLKVENGWTENSLTGLLQLLQIVLPSGNKMPSSTYRAKKIVANMSLDYQKIHACPNDCILYWREHESIKTCLTCGLSRFKVVTVWASNSRRKLLVRKKVLAKVLRYFPITLRLQRLYSVPWVEK